ncbi:MAG: TetR/AcrR family transcriptional regulator [Acetobacter sp.]|uniref:TetR/AcrR family transcriptional regulator n=1 Tax=Acetobacter sp. TaxID=440 RepID=UPI0039E72E9B
MVTPQGKREASKSNGMFAGGVTRIFVEGADLSFEPRKWPHQARSEATIDAILEATAQLLETGRSFSTNAIAERAGVGIATLYQYFENKESVVAALSRRVRETLVDDVASLLETACSLPLSEGVRCLVVAAVKADKSRPSFTVRLDRLEAALSLEADHLLVAAELCAIVASFLKCQGIVQEDDAQILADDLCTITGALIDAAHNRQMPIDDFLIDRITRRLVAIIQGAL